MHATDFPTLERAAERLGYARAYAQAVARISEGAAADSIRNVHLNDAKSTLASVVWNAWFDEVLPRIDRSQRRYWPDALSKLFENMHLSGLHDVVVAKNKLARTKAQGQQVDVLRAFVEEVLPLAEAAESLKRKAVKGRLPSARPPSQNPDKVIKQCPCCYRDIAVSEAGKMVHHGYQRPGDGFQTPSCWGINYVPLQESTEGLEFVVQWRTERLDQEKAYRERLETATEVSVLIGFRAETYKAGDPKWDWALKWEKGDADRKIAALEGQLRVDRFVLANWTRGERQMIPAYIEGPEEVDEAEPASLRP